MRMLVEVSVEREVCRVSSLVVLMRIHLEVAGVSKPKTVKKGSV